LPGAQATGDVEANAPADADHRHGCAIGQAAIDDGERRHVADGAGSNGASPVLLQAKASLRGGSRAAMRLADR